MQSTQSIHRAYTLWHFCHTSIRQHCRNELVKFGIDIRPILWLNKAVSQYAMIKLRDSHLARASEGKVSWPPPLWPGGLISIYPSRRREGFSFQNTRAGTRIGGPPGPRERRGLGALRAGISTVDTHGSLLYISLNLFHFRFENLFEFTLTGGALKEVVQKILETEKEVRESIERAHADAQAILRDAEHQSRLVDEKIRQQAIHAAQEIAERMKQEAEAERQQQTSQAQGARSELFKRKSAEIEAATKRVVDLIFGIGPR